MKVLGRYSVRVDLANGSFGLGSVWVKFGSGKVRVTQILFGFGFGFGSIRVKFGLIEFGFSSILVRVEFGLG